MYVVSSGYDNEIYKPDAQHNLRIKIDNVIINNDYVFNLNYSHDVFSSSVFELGSTNARKLNLKLYNNGTIDKDIDKVVIDYGLLVEDDYEWVPLGQYRVESIDDTVSGVLTLVLTDYMTIFDVPYDPSSIVPCTRLELLQDICSKFGVSLGNTSFLNSDKQVNTYDSTLNANFYIRCIAERAGGFAQFGRDGKLYIKNFDEVNRVTIPYEYLNNPTIGETLKITRVIYEDGLNHFEFGDDSGVTVYLAQDNIFNPDEEEIKSIYNKIKNITFTSVKTKILGDPKIDAGDFVCFQDDNNTLVTIAQPKFTFNGRFMLEQNLDIKKSNQESHILRDNTGAKIRKIQSHINDIDLEIDTIIQEQSTQEATINNIQNGLDDLVDQIDSNITYYKGNYVPTLENEPASEWTTDELKDNHLGDLFYNTETGIAYRFVKDGVVYKWEEESNDVAEAIELAEDAISKATAAQNTANSAQSIATGAQNTAEGAQTTANNALSTANNAQSSANSKRRVFVTEPVPPYDVGDLWTDGEDIYVCKTVKTEGQTFSQDDWENTTNYAEQIDTTNVKLNETISNLDGTNSVIANLQTTLTNDYLNAEQIESITNGQAEDIEAISGQITQIQAQAGSIDLRVTEIETNGVSKVSTVTGTFDLEGLHITKVGEAMSSLLDWDGFVVKRDQTEVLTVRSSGVESENLKVRKWLTLEPARFEKVHAISDSKEEGIGIFI